MVYEILGNDERGFTTIEGPEIRIRSWKKLALFMDSGKFYRVTDEIVEVSKEDAVQIADAISKGNSDFLNAIVNVRDNAKKEAQEKADRTKPKLGDW